MIRQRLRGVLERWLLRVWYGPASHRDRLLATLAAPVGVPLSWLVAAVARRRRRLIVKQRAASGTAPVVVVGNLVAGGSGKTPLVAAIAHALVEAGFHPGLIAGGYRSRAAPGRGPDGSSGDAALVDGFAEASHVGDEALLLAQETGLPLAVGRNRGAAAALLRNSHPECDVIVSDDGLQHVGLVRQLELLVVDARGFGNGRCLPAGPLREPADRLASVDAVILSSVDGDRLASVDGDRLASVDGDRLASVDAGVLASAGTVAAASQVPVFRSVLKTTAFRTLDGASRWLPEEFAARFADDALTAIAGIARPERFFSSLAAFGLCPRCHPLPDHADIDEGWLAALPGRWILLTSKDAVKCVRFAPTLLQRLVRVDVAAAPDAALLKWLAVQLRPTAHRNG